VNLLIGSTPCGSTCRNLKVLCEWYCRTDFEKFEADETLVVIVVLL
jgi:hypothetical protein